MNFHLKVWRQANSLDRGKLVNYEAKNIPAEASFLEMLDIVNEDLVRQEEEPIQFDHDCREGICGTCSLTINGIPHGPGRGTTCQLYMRKFQDGDTIYVEPFRVGSFPIIRDLSIDRSALDRIIQAGGFVSERCGSAPEANATLVPKVIADLAMDAAACIGCGACAGACPNSSAMLFVAAKISHLSLLPQGQAESKTRAFSMVHAMDAEGFGGCSNFYECEAVCPASIPVETIARMNRQYTIASFAKAVGAKHG